MRLSSKSFDTKIMAKRIMLFNPNRFGSTYFRKSHQNAVHKNKQPQPSSHQVKLLTKL